MDDGLAGRLREVLSGLGFTYDGVAEVLGATAHAALGRNETTPGLRATTGGSALETLIRLWPLQAAVTAEQAEQALPGLVEEMTAAGFVEQSGGEVRALLDVRPYATDERDLWVASDLTPGMDGAAIRVAPDHVLGISPAATSLAQLTPRRSVGRALDLGTGCGVQALHLAAHADQVVATDVNRRALELTRFNAALNGVLLEAREGSLFDPVAGERYDLIVTNPPFVISPGGGERLVYRDSGMPGDEVVEHVVRTAPRHLTDGGTAHVVANWMIERGRSWEERLEEWLPGDCDAWVVQREVLDLPGYVELWLKDAGLHPSTGSGQAVADYHRRYDSWLSWLEEQGADGVGFGWITVRRGGGTHRLEEWRYDVEQPIAPEVAAWLGRIGHLDFDLLSRTLVTREDVRQETFGAPGAEDPEQIVLRQQRGMRRARQVDTVEAGLVGACDGDLTVGQILDALCTLLERDDLRETHLPVVRELVEEGYLLP